MGDFPHRPQVLDTGSEDQNGAGEEYDRDRQLYGKGHGAGLGIDGLIRPDACQHHGNYEDGFDDGHGIDGCGVFAPLTDPGLQTGRELGRTADLSWIDEHPGSVLFWDFLVLRVLDLVRCQLVVLLIFYGIGLLCTRKGRFPLPATGLAKQGTD